MQVINIHDAKTHLSRLVAAATEGESFVIAKSGKPLVKVVPYTEKKKPINRIGFMPLIAIPDNFDELFEEDIHQLFEGKEK
ncbi:type II toxin-antitoxin system prevent-host-death family antitoxin [Pelistega sp. NLN82]|uniref:Antitoxin n=1 Tax=Pelistega ratti TaxID=2652177 RepID=A0A6L9Y3M7_9BURK|nr:type II toxin-antitoxin system prevent-host-death family antitoxin [Pelistega ratti]NEN75022.1 type II toxin-antitoxin system prevent-host-death family antitoxin [Pelistega ratti]